LFSDAAPLPAAAVENAEAAWDYYIRNWRPGKPHRATWDGFWASGVTLAGQNAAPAQGAPVAPAVVRASTDGGATFNAAAADYDALARRVAALEARMEKMARALT
jgi:hypothetical protein